MTLPIAERELRIFQRWHKEGKSRLKCDLIRAKEKEVETKAR